LKKIVLSFIAASSILLTSGQSLKLVMKPDSICGKDALIWNAPGFNNGNTNYGSFDAIGAHAWTNNGTPDTGRTLLQFDLSAIPVGSTITYAYLSLYNNPNTTYGQGLHSTLSGGNDLYVQRITSQWDEHTVTWFTQPTSTAQNEVSVPASTSANQDYPSIIVTSLVQDMVDNPLTSFGFMLRLQDEAYYRAMIYASSDCPDATKWPGLTINYTPPATACITLQPHDGCGKDAMVWNAPPYNNGNTNYGSHEALGAHAWTNQGTPDTARSLLQFDLSVIPSNAIITSAMLSLYNNPTTVYANGAHSWLSGPNTGLLQRITTYWDEKTVTWFTQPASTTANEVTIPASTTIHQDYPNMDVTQLVTDMINDPLNSYGFMIRLVDEQQYRALVFASCNYSDQSRNPKLEICYSIQNGVETNPGSSFVIYPNPAHQRFCIESGRKINAAVSVELFNVMGEKIYADEVMVPGLFKKEIIVSDYSPGIYFLNVKSGEEHFTKEIVVE
jgi:hypothetical protein